MQLLKAILCAGTGIAGTLLTALYVFQERILYHPSMPSREYINMPSRIGLNYQDVELVTDDNVKLHAWLITQNDSKNAPTFIYLHGNAGNISHRLPDVRFFYASGFNVFMLSYRGYGMSNGSPSEKGLRLDAKASLQYLCDREDVIDKNRIYIFGRSIGGACAIALAASPLGQDVVKGVIVENTFTSIDDMIDVIFPFLTFAKPFNRNKWNSLNEIAHIKVPILFMSGLKDELVPPSHMRKLYDSAVNARFTSFHPIEEGRHNDTWHVGGRVYRDAMKQFLQRVETPSQE